MSASPGRGLSFGAPLTETNSVSVTPTLEDDSLFFESNSKVRARQGSYRHSFAQFDSADRHGLAAVIEFESRN